MKMKAVLTGAALAAITVMNAGALNAVPEGAWYADALKKSVESGFITYENDTYTADEPVTVGDVNTAVRVIAAIGGSAYSPVFDENVGANATRGYFCGMLGAMYMQQNEAAPETYYLPDVSVFDREGDAIFALYGAGILCGDEAGCFNGGETLTKEAFSAILTRYLYPECRVQKELPKGVSAREVFARYEEPLTEDDAAAYAVSDTGYTIAKSLYDFAADVQGEEAAEETLTSIAAIEKLLYLYDYSVSEEMYAELLDYFAGDWAQAEPYIAENGMDVSRYAYFQNYVLSNYYDVMSNDFLYHAMPTNHEIYEEYGGSYVLAKHILIQSDGTEEGKASALAKITEIKGLLDGGADFDTLMENYGEDPGMKQTPGGYCFTRGEMVEPFENAAFALQEDQMSGIVETDYGYHIIYRLPLTEEIFCSNTDLCVNIAYYTAYADWQSICSIVASSVVLEKK